MAISILAAILLQGGCGGGGPSSASGTRAHAGSYDEAASVELACPVEAREVVQDDDAADGGPAPTAQEQLWESLRSRVRGCESVTVEQARRLDLPPECQETVTSVATGCRGFDLEEITSRDTFSPECKAALRAALVPAESGSLLVAVGATFGDGGANLHVAHTGATAATSLDLEVELVLADGTVVPIPANGFAVSESPAGPLPTSIVSVLDYSGSMSDEDVDHSIALFDAMWRTPWTSEAEGAVSLFSTGIRERMAITSDRDRILAALERDPTMERATTALYDAIGMAVVDLSDRPSPSRFVVVATDGQENASRCFTKASLVALARRHDVRLIFWGSLVADVDDMRELAAATGGTFFYDADLEALRARVEPLAASLAQPTRVRVTDSRLGDAREVCVRAVDSRLCSTVPPGPTRR